MKSIYLVVVLIAGIIVAGPAFAADRAKIYAEKCSACHGAKGTGPPGIAPALLL